MIAFDQTAIGLTFAIRIQCGLITGCNRGPGGDPARTQTTATIVRAGPAIDDPGNPHLRVPIEINVETPFSWGRHGRIFYCPTHR